MIYVISNELPKLVMAILITSPISFISILIVWVPVKLKTKLIEELKTNDTEKIKYARLNIYLNLELSLIKVCE